MFGEPFSRLCEILDNTKAAAIAVSGGIDSMVLAFVAIQYSSCEVKVFHAVSPAVPEESTERVNKYARVYDWELQLINAGEFTDKRYVKNPLNRCFYCKTNLYQVIKEHANAVVFSGANLTDLGDFRPGLDAAKKFDVRHPFIEAEITKTDIRKMAKNLSLNDLARLPAQPCLASRIVTGIPIDEKILNQINKVEKQVSSLFDLTDIRCRWDKNSIRVEIGEFHYRSLNASKKAIITQIVEKVFNDLPPTEIRSIEISPYIRGSAFIET